MPGDGGYDGACAGFELAIQHRPALVVLPENAQEVITAVEFARGQSLPVAIQATGHGQLWSCDGGVLVNTCRMRQVAIDPVHSTARVEGGAQWKDVLPRAQEHGLAPLCGTSPEVGVVGYTLGGGTGWLARKYGYAADSVTAIEVVTGEGQLLRATAGENADLFWALRGGAGSFGIVTALEFRLYPVAQVYGGALFFPVERAREVFAAYTAWCAELPDSLTSTICIQHIPPMPFVPEPLRGRSVVAVQLCYAGTEQEGAQLVSPLRELGPMLDFVGMMPFSEVGRIASEPVDPMHTFIGTQTLAELPAELFEQVIEATADPARTSLAIVAFRHIEGAYRRLPENASAVSRPDAKYLMISVGVVMAPPMKPRVAADTRALVETTRPWCTGTPIRNFVTWNASERAEELELFAAAKYERLARIKEQYDPLDLFRFGLPVVPAPMHAIA